MALLVKAAQSVVQRLLLRTPATITATISASDIVAAVRHLVLIANDDLIAGTLTRNGLVTDVVPPSSGAQSWAAMPGMAPEGAHLRQPRI